MPEEPAPAAESSPVAPEAATAAAVFHETTAELKFPNTKISGEALKIKLEEVVTKVLHAQPPVGVTRTDPVSGLVWDGKDTTGYEDWTVTLPLPKDQSAAVLSELKVSLEKTPVWQGSNAIQGQVTVDTQLKALTAILFSLVGIVAYVWFRFQNLSWGIAAVAALVHDTLVMLGFIALSYWLAGALGFLQVEEFKISLTIVAAFLT
ncbi:MAG TPA: protein translocase subunit SecDF, partial [bacterium]|nr:protein translocase subunit SecDF [bacterium]